MSSQRGAPLVGKQTMRQILGESTFQLIEKIAQQAQSQHQSLFLVGGVVRDIILKTPSQDLDFVLEADAIHFAHTLAATFGGTVLAHKPFGTAVWTLDSAAADKLSLPQKLLPSHVDFAAARSESYSHPGSLPTVSPADIRSDLLRRDFPLNTLAIQLSPAHAFGRILDECGGINDLNNRQIRVLHDDSFIDDPTRILRAVRLSLRLGFDIEAKTDQLLQAGLPYLNRVTGPRLANELDLTLSEPKAGKILLRLQEYGALSHIHPAFCVSADLPNHLTRLRNTAPPWQSASDARSVAWSVLLAAIGEDNAAATCRRLDLSRKLMRSVAACARLMAAADVLRAPQSAPSQVSRLLDGLPESALHAVWILFAGNPVAQNKVANYVLKWQQQRPVISGVDLEQMGIPPGPRYKKILDALRYAWIDGKVQSSADEQALLKELLARTSES